MRDFGPVDLTDYIFQERAGFLTTAEEVAYEALILTDKFRRSSFNDVKLLLIRRHPHTAIVEAELLLAGGEQFFKERVITRLLVEHGETCLNLCPRCHALCRTRRAQQCPRCFFAWHGEHPDTIGEQ